MRFWSSTTAAPSVWDMIGVGRRSGYIRTTMPPLYPQDHAFGRVRAALAGDESIVADFLIRNYRGSDWRIGADCRDWIAAYLRDADVVCLILQSPSGEVLGSIFSVPFGASETRMTNGERVRCLRVIEGLAVAPSVRGHGLAGFLIAHMDAWTSYKFGVCAHIWSREIVAAPMFLSSALQVATYAYKVCGGGAPPGDLEIIPWDAFAALWRASAPDWTAMTDVGAAIVAVAPAQLRRGGLTVYRYRNLVAVVSATGRVTDGDDPIYEVIWCGLTLSSGNLMPACAASTIRYKHMLDVIAARSVRGIVFATDDPLGGGASPTWEADGWVYGRSGAHATYIYNYIPPTFGSCRVHCLREEI